MFDVFYTGPKPNLFAFEQPAKDLDDAAAQCRTGYYCIFMVKMITATSILILYRPLGKAHTYTFGQHNGINLVAPFWRM